MASGNPTVAAAQQDTGMAPLNTRPSSPQPPQHDPVVVDPTIDTIPKALQGIPEPFEAFVLPLDTNPRSSAKSNHTISSGNYPTESQFEDLVKAGLHLEGPVRAEHLKPQGLKWPDGYREVVKHVESVDGEQHVGMYKVFRGQHKAEVYVVSLDTDNERLVGVRFPDQ
ncbi:hypothetical protein B0A55_09747 [Friedmanniomyces simplex]|uniref:Uncharacterized protein n=1 Tax=Friedmanniomyces simplex TaxID=329884 RepID=A0A4U0WP40_9PEZI|nr:hypothetical protein B0A55_09747 [Friedmanniomyces simplex]